MHGRQDPIVTPFNQTIYVQGPPQSEGPLPALIYLALSGIATLYEDPFNQPAVALQASPLRIFSWDLPFHGEGLDHREAMQHWAHSWVQNPHFLDDFLDMCSRCLDYLMETGWIDVQRLAIAGLSRGGYIATQLAARDARLPIVLGFAPLTRPRPLDEFAQLQAIPDNIPALHELIPHLTHKQIRFYIGNRDTRVGTDMCFSFIHNLAEKAFAQGVYSPAAELIVYPSIGYRGHGTPPAIFQAGAQWIQEQLLR